MAGEICGKGGRTGTQYNDGCGVSVDEHPPAGPTVEAVRPEHASPGEAEMVFYHQECLLRKPPLGT